MSSPHRFLVVVFALLAVSVAAVAGAASGDRSRPHIVLVMADDMGWGQTSYNGHPVLKTPHLDAMASAGLRFDRFYAGAPNCSPTRATVMTGRSNDRTGVLNHGYALRRQEKTVAQALRSAGYVTGHFGKWHLGGYSGPGAPVLADDAYSPGAFGFEEWLSVTNFFDRNPLLSRRGRFEDFTGDSSEIVVDEALKFIAQGRGQGKPTFTVIWFGSPHAPMIASDEDRAPFRALELNSQHHYGELAAMDRSIGALRQGLRRLGIAENTLVWFCSDNGGLPEVRPGSVGDLRGFKNTMYEGGLRVPGVLEWPAVVAAGRVTRYQAGTVDIFPTLADITGVAASALLAPVDGISLKPLLTAELDRRPKPLAFRHTNRAALIDGQYKIVSPNLAQGKFEVYDLEADPREATDIAATQPAVATRLRTALLEWSASVEASAAGRDYPEGRAINKEPATQSWMAAPEYQRYLKEWQKRPEFQATTSGKKKKKG